MVSMFASHVVGCGFMPSMHQDGVVVSMFASHVVGCVFAPRPCHTKDHHKNGTKCLPAW